MTKLKYYTYKVTFKDLPCYFYYGVRKDNGKPYFGSPKTWKRLWSLFEPEVQVLQWHSTAKEAKAAEEAIIRATWDSQYSLNEHYGGHFSDRVCIGNGIKTGPENVKKMNEHVNTAAARVGNGSRNGSKNIGAAWASLTPEILSKNGKENGAKTGADNGKKSAEKTGKRVLLTNTSTGENSEFPSAHEACRLLGLTLGHLCSVARGVRKQHKGYTAIYL